MTLEHGPLPVDPAAALAGLPVGHAREHRTERGREPAEDVFGGGERDAADQVHEPRRAHRTRAPRSRVATRSAIASAPAGSRSPTVIVSVTLRGQGGIEISPTRTSPWRARSRGSVPVISRPS